MKIFICYTVFQLLVACTIKEQLGIQNAYLFLGSDSLKSCETNTTLNEMFNHVKWIDTMEWEAKKKRYFLNPDPCLKEMLGWKEDKIFDEVFYYNNHGVLEFLYKYARKRHMQVAWHIFEEGNLMYAADTLINLNIMYYWSWRYRYANVLLWGFDPRHLPQDIYVFNPDLVDELTASKWNLKKIDVQVTRKILPKLNEIFCSRTIAGETIKEKYIFLGESADGFPSVEEYVNLVNSVAKMVGYDNIIYKPHPRVPLGSVDKRIKILDSNCPWELYVLNSDLSNKVLVFISTGAACTSIGSWDYNITGICLWDMAKQYYKTVPHYLAIYDAMDVFRRKCEKIKFVSRLDDLNDLI